jgi:hypothetical protein
MCFHPLHLFYCIKDLHHMIPHRHLDIKYEHKVTLMPLLPYKYVIYDE